MVTLLFVAERFAKGRFVYSIHNYNNGKVSWYIEISSL